MTDREQRAFRRGVEAMRSLTIAVLGEEFDKAEKARRKVPWPKAMERLRVIECKADEQESPA